MPGGPDLGEPPANARVRSAFAALGVLHNRLARKIECGPSPAIATRVGELEGLVEGGYARLARIVSGAADSEPELGRLAAEWVAKAGVKAPEVLERLRAARGRSVALQPCLRDTRPEHFLFIGDRLTGLVDFGAMGVECVAADLARLVADWLGPDEGLRRAAVEAYKEINPAAAGSLALMAAFEESQAVMGGVRWITWAWGEGRSFEPGTVEAGLWRSIKRLETLDRLGHP
jgi:Ser/Thr protein kinase RdoA (MazF antagonist)